MTTEFARIQNRGGTEAALLAENQVPLERELVVATDTGKAWIGDGVSQLTELTPLGASTDAVPGADYRIQNSDASYPTTGISVPVYVGTTAPDPTTLTGEAFYIQTATP